MTFKTWLTELIEIQGVLNNINRVELWANGGTGLLEQNVVNDLSSAIKGLDLQQAQLALSTKNLTKEQMNQVLVQAGIIASEDKIQAELVQSALAQSALSEETQKAILLDAGLAKKQTNEILLTQACTKEKLLEVLASKGVTGAQADEIISTLGLTSANSGLKISFDLLVASIKKTMVALATNPMTWVAIGAVAIYGLVKAYNTLTVSSEEAIEAAEEAANEAKKRIEQYEEERDSLAELIEKYKELKESDTWDTTTRQKVLEIQNEITSLVGTQADSLDLVNGKLDDELEKLYAIKNTISEDSISKYEDAYITAAKATKANLNVKNGNTLYDTFYDAVDGKNSENSITIDYFGNNKERDEALKIINDIWQEKGYGEAFEASIGVDSFSKLKFNPDLTISERIDAINSALEALRNYSSDDIDYTDIELYDELDKIYNALESTYSQQVNAANDLLNEVITQAIDIEHSIMSDKDFILYRNDIAKELFDDKTIQRIISDGVYDKDGIRDYIDTYLSTYKEFTAYKDTAEYRDQTVKGTFGSVYNRIEDPKDPNHAKKIMQSLYDWYDSLDDDKKDLAYTITLNNDTASWELEEWQKALNDAIEENKISFSDLLSEEDTDTSKGFLTQIDEYKEKISQLQETQEKYQDFLSGDLSGSEFNDYMYELIQSFPELAGQTDNLDEALENLINELTGSEDEFGNATGIYKVFSDAFGRLKTDEDKAQLQSLMDIVLNSEQIVGNFSTSLSSLKNSFSSLTSAESSFASALTTLYTGDYDSSELLSSVMEINDTISSLGAEIDWESIDSLDELQAKLLAVSDTYADSMLADAGIDTDSGFAKMIKNSIMESVKLKAQLDSVNNSLDSLQSNYDSLSDIVETYNEKGFITIDQLQTLLSMDDKYVACLIDENGQLKLNKDTYSRLVQVKLDEARATALAEYETAVATITMNAQQRQTENLSNAIGNSGSGLIGKLTNLCYKFSTFNLLASQSNIILAGYKKRLDKITGKSGSTGYDTQYEKEMAEAEAAYAARLKAIEAAESGLNSSFDTIMGSSSGSASSSSGAADDFKETFNWIETAIDRIERSVSSLGSTAGSTYKTWSARSAALKSEMSKLTEEISLQQQAYSKYMQQANAVGLSSAYKKLVQNGKIDISTVTDETLADKISEYQEWYEKALDCKDAVEELNSSLSEAYKTAFDNVSARYDNILSVFEHQKSMLDEAVSQSEEKGYLTSVKYYEALMKTERSNITQLEKEKAALLSALNDAVAGGSIKKQSEDWYEMCSQIDEVTLAIEEANTAMLEYGNSIRDIEWEVFDLLQDKISQITTEADFLLDLLESDTLYDDRGQMTGAGLSAMGLHGVDYNVYMAQADEYAKELLNINKQLADDPYNQDLADRRQELLELQQEMILAAEDEKQAIVDMVEEGIELELDALKDLIDTYTDALDAQKDLYDYQKKVADQTSEIASLQKQLSAYEGDTSEETRTKIQQLKVSLEEAKTELEETEYERYISDQKELLEELYNEYELVLNSRLDNIDMLITDMINEINNGASVISSTLSEKAEAVGYTLSESMASIWSSNSAKLTAVLTVYGTSLGDSISSASTTVNNTLHTINTNLKGMISQLNAIAGTKVTAAQTSSAATGSTAAKTAAKTSGSASGSSSAASGSKASGTSGTASAKWGSWFISKKDSNNKSKLNKETSIVDRLKYFDFDSSYSARAKYFSAMGGSGVYSGSASQNMWMISEMKKHSFAKGGRIGSLINRTGEDGFVLARSGEAILTAAQAEQFAELVGKLDRLNYTLDIPEYLSRLSWNTAKTDAGKPNYTFETNIAIDHVEDYDDLVAKMKTDRRFEKLVQSMTVDRTVGGSSLRKYKC